MKKKAGYYVLKIQEVIMDGEKFPHLINVTWLNVEKF